MTDALALWLGERLLIGSLQAVLIVALLWLACRLVPRIPAAAQAALWWLVAMKLVLVFAPVPSVPVPLLPADFQRHTERIFLQPLTAGDGVTLISRGQAGDFAVVGHPDRVLISAINSWFQALLLIWFVAILVQAGRLVLAHRHLRGIVRRSVPWAADETVELARRIGLTRTPPVRLSDEIDGPQVCGLWSLVVLLPTETMTTLSVEERSMTLCHELMHVRRRDLAFGWVPACAERLFFFHPFARLAAREYVAAREAACDAGAMRALGVPAGDYGRMLIRLGLGNAGPTLAAGGSPFSASSLKRRLHMLEHHRLSNLSRRWRWAIVVLAAVVIPIQLVARTPDTPPVSGPSFDLYQLLVGLSAKVQGKEIAVASNPREDRDEFYRKLTAPEQSKGDRTVKRDDVVLLPETEKVKVDKLKAKLDNGLGKDQEIRLKIAKLVERVEQERAAEEQVDRSKLHEQLAAQVELQIRALAEVRKAAEQLRQQTNRDQDVNSQIQRLAERLERLAAEQRQLAEELERIRSQSPRR